MKGEKMRFSVGLWDALFGKKVTCELPAPDGQIVKRQVTKKWLDKMQQAGEVKQIDEPLIRVHMLHPSGNTVEYWTVGKDIDQETVDNFRDAESGDIYALTTPTATVKQHWLCSYDSENF